MRVLGLVVGAGRLVAGEVDLAVEGVEIGLRQVPRGVGDPLVVERDPWDREGRRGRDDVTGEGVESVLGRGETEGAGEGSDLDKSAALGDLAAGGDGGVDQALESSGGRGQGTLAGVEAGGEIINREVRNIFLPYL